MKIKISEIKELVIQVIEEAAKEGSIQKVYRNSFKRMISKTRKGKNKNTPPFTKRAADPGKSGPAQ